VRVKTEQLPNPVCDVPNVVYLDDSGSMVQYQIIPYGVWSMRSKFRWDKQCLLEGHKVLIDLAHFLEGTPTRVVKFGATPSIVEEFVTEETKTAFGSVKLGRLERRHRPPEMLRQLLLETRCFEVQSDLQPLLDAWDGTSNGTYMWKMIDVDIKGNFDPGAALRVHLITDGQDTNSPAPFTGEAGMDALMASLEGSGYQIEWNIVVLLVGVHNFTGSAIRRYQELCDNSGGVFRIITDGFRYNDEDKDVRAYLAQYDAQEAQRRYQHHMVVARTSPLSLPPPKEG